MTEPFLKWPGGKRWAAKLIADLVRSHLSGRYFEPFLGGGAVFFELQPREATLSDVNTDLVNTYAQVRDQSSAIRKLLKTMRVTKRDYYRVRRSEPTDAVERATRFLYLNRTAFAGMYRVNRAGRFNVPYGGGDRTPESLWNTSLLTDARAALARVELVVSDFEPMLDRAEEGDVVYCDPTYTVAHDNNGFVRYNERNFSWDDQRRLSNAAKRAATRGATVIVSNAFHESIRKLYAPYQGERLERQSLISPNIQARRLVAEYLLVVAPKRSRATLR